MSPYLLEQLELVLVVSNARPQVQKLEHQKMLLSHHLSHLITSMVVILQTKQM